MGLGIVSHGLGADLSVDRLYGTEVVGRVFVKYVNLPLARGSEYGATFRVENSSINPAADGQTLDNFSVISIHDNEHFRIPRSNKEAPVYSVHCHRDRSTAWRHRPMRFYFHCASVNDDNFILVHKVGVKSTLPIGCGKFGFSAQFNRPDQGLGLGINRRRASGIPVQSKNPF